MNPAKSEIITFPNGDQIGHIWTSNNPDEYVIGYMCKVNWDYEIGNASGGNRIYPSLEDLKRCTKCWKGCGIVEVKVFFSKVIEEGTV